jgi:hypothetical protein
MLRGSKSQPSSLGGGICEQLYDTKSKFNLVVDEKIQVSRKLLEEFLREFF